MEQTINLADLVKPKFEAGQDVYAVGRDYRGKIEWVRPIRIESIEFKVVIKRHPGGLNGGPRTSRDVWMRYYAVSGSAEYSESQQIGRASCRERVCQYV